MSNKKYKSLQEQANLYLTLSIIFFIPVIIYIFYFVQYGGFEGIYHLLPGIPALISSYFWSRFATLRSGIKGEKHTKKVLNSLSEYFKTFNSVQISIEEGRTEIDQVVVGKDCIFIIEVKNHKGRIEGHEAEHSWTQHKIGRKGTPYKSKMKNPLKQVKRQTFILARYLKKHNVNVWVEEIVYFSNPNAKVNAQSSKYNVLSKESDLTNYLINFQPKRKASKEDIEIATKLLSGQNEKSEAI
ncbi:nuclease-related domain-containing protein [Aquisalibacillus elongatus]|uniref:Nuclease-like protein n=1 Tax=Aquisalibacillus elongatus TaxID=485577 RepID=A0A3N5B7S9_9BACI|nr:nuclease-related domain-containing protein [Aquisalibacillus elongatus]RPF53367.1 nuclease-like protein [Aquisalibacillus elongatus]